MVLDSYFTTESAFTDQIYYRQNTGKQKVNKIHPMSLRSSEYNRAHKYSITIFTSHLLFNMCQKQLSVLFYVYNFT